MVWGGGRRRGRRAGARRGRGDRKGKENSRDCRRTRALYIFFNADLEEQQVTCSSQIHPFGCSLWLQIERRQECMHECLPRGVQGATNRPHM